MKTHMTLGGLALVMALAGCGGGGGGKAELVRNCVAQGESQANCQCVADAAEESLDDKTFAALVKASRGGEEDMEAAMNEAMSDMSEAEQMAVGLQLMSAVMACASEQQ